MLSFNAVLQLGPPAVVPRPQRTAGQKRGLTARFFSAEKMENGCDSMGLMGFNGDLMGFHGDLMGFNGDLMGFNGDLMKFNSDLMGFYGFNGTYLLGLI